MPLTRREFLDKLWRTGAAVGGAILLEPLVSACNFFFPKSQEEYIEELYRNFDTLHDPNYWIGNSMVSPAEVERIFRDMFFNPSEALKKALGANENEYATFARVASDTLNAFGKLSAGMKALDIQLMYADRAKSIAEFNMNTGKWDYKNPFRTIWKHRGSDFAKFEDTISVIKGDLDRAAAFSSRDDAGAYLSGMFRTSRAFILDDLEYVRRRRKEKDKGDAKGSDISEPPNLDVQPDYADIVRVRVYKESKKGNIVFEITTRGRIPEEYATIGYAIELDLIAEKANRHIGNVRPPKKFSTNIDVDTIFDIYNRELSDLSAQISKRKYLWGANSASVHNLINRIVDGQSYNPKYRVEVSKNIINLELERYMSLGDRIIEEAAPLFTDFRWRVFSYTPGGLVSDLGNNSHGNLIDSLPSEGYGTFTLK